MFQLVNDYCAANGGVSNDAIFASLERLRKIVNNLVGVIELTEKIEFNSKS